METKNPIAVVFMGLVKAVKFVIITLAWVIIIGCVLTKNR